MKKVTIYSICVAGLIIMMSACYYFSYEHALHDFSKDTAKQKKSQVNVEFQKEAEEAGRHNENTVSPDAEYTLQIYDMATDKTTSRQENIPNAMVGLNRAQVIGYLNDYMQDIPISEYNKGLVSFNLESFASDKVIVKKTYNSQAIVYKYYLQNCDNEVVVYYSDKKTVYENTGISVSSLPEEDQTQLKYGVYIKDDKELASTLESYTS